MLYFIPWLVLMIAVVVAVPVAAKMNPGPKRPRADAENEEVLDAAGEEVVAMDDDFGGEPVAEPLDDDAFAEFN